MGNYALGIWVGTGFLHGALVERTENGWAVPVYRAWSRSEGQDADMPFAEPEASGPGMEGDADDLMIDFDDAGSDGGMMVGAEFDELGQEGTGAASGGAESWDFRAALDDLLEECEEKGYEDPEIAFCAEASMLDQVELRLPKDEGHDYPEEEYGQRRPLPARRDTLLERLDEQYEGAVESERVGFVAMHPSEDGRKRVLAFVARPGGSVISTLEGMQEQTMTRSPQAHLFDVEVPLFAGLARSAIDLPAESADKSIVVRAGVEDTTILFMEGNTLRQAEHLPEITVEDPLETICSRVLLLQDEHQMGEVQHVLLASEDDEEGLADAFRSYFSRSQLQLLRESLPGNGERVPENVHVGAVGTALRMLGAEDFNSFSQGLNLLPKRCEPSWLRLPVGWSVPALLGGLALTTLVFVWYFIANANAISERRSELRRLEAQLEQIDAQEIRRQNDSIKAAAAQYSEGVDVLNQLLKGSNKWSRSLARTTEQIEEVEAISLSDWDPGEETVTLTGRATSRTKVVEFARKRDAKINEITYTDIRDYPLYTFELTVPLPTDMPKVVPYWREQVDSLQTQTDSLDSGNGLSATNLFFHAGEANGRFLSDGERSFLTGPFIELVAHREGAHRGSRAVRTESSRIDDKTHSPVKGVPPVFRGSEESLSAFPRLGNRKARLRPSRTRTRSERALGDELPLAGAE
jgi:hypothetical protein